ncbi:MAG: hypothetical protein IKW34_03415 [Clostridia bacterium]|nr:hypothetical protein [Clostridia bacterium]
MKNNKFSSLLKEWYEGNLSFDERIDDKHKEITAVNEEPEIKKIPLVKKVENAEKNVSSKGYKFFSVIFCVILAVVLIGTINFMPLFADDNTPTTNEVYEHYVGEGRDQTGAVNTVAGMILDYRAFDTLGESFVLFTATCAVLLLLEQNKNKPLKKRETFTYSNDPIVCTIVKILTPIIIIFGIYVLFNGHLSPGGGFSGGSVLGAGFILFAMAFGEDNAAKVIKPIYIRIITICSLSFYCLAKSYSFFTGNEFNGVHSVITPGTPGDFLSGGLILPLNIAVGFIVCCTMYSFYMIFKRGRLD